METRLPHYCGPWSDMELAWGRGVHLSSSAPGHSIKAITGQLEQHNYKAVLNPQNHTLLQHMLGSPCRYCADFRDSKHVQHGPIDWPKLGPGTYTSQHGDISDIKDSDSMSAVFQSKAAGFDPRWLASDYKTLKPRFTPPRHKLFAGEEQFEVNAKPTGTLQAHAKAQPAPDLEQIPHYDVNVDGPHRITAISHFRLQETSKAAKAQQLC